MPLNSSLRVVIPARYGSQRLPGKPLIDLGGKPMIVRVHEAVVSALGPVDVTVAVDDLRVLDVVSAAGLSAVMTRSTWESGTDRVAEVARIQGWRADDVIINVQGDEPLVPALLLQEFAKLCLSSRDFQMGTVCAPVTERRDLADPNVVKVLLDKRSDAVAFSRAAIPYNRDRPIHDWVLSDYKRHLGIYGYRNETLQTLTSEPLCDMERIEKLEQLRALWLGIPIRVLQWESTPPAGVDTQADADRVRAFLRDQLN